MVFPDVYMFHDAESDTYYAETPRQKSLVQIEYVIDVIYLFEIMLNFVKKTRAHKDIQTIAYNYVTGTFFFDVIGTIPELIFMQQ